MPIHPKVKAATIVGVVYAVAVTLAQAYNYTPDPRVAAAVGPLVAVVAAYLKGSQPAAPPLADQPDPVDPTVDLTPDPPAAAKKKAA